MFEEGCKRFGWQTLPLVFFILIVTELYGCSRTHLVRNGTVDQSVVEQIKRKIEVARGLGFRQDVQVRIVTLAVARDAFGSLFLQQYGDKSTFLAAMNAGSCLNGLLPPDPRYGSDWLLNSVSALLSSDLITLPTSPTEILVVEGGAERYLARFPFRLKLANALRHPVEFLAGLDRFEDDGFTEYQLAAALDGALVDQNFGLADKFATLHGNHDAEDALTRVKGGDSEITANIAIPNGSAWGLSVCGRVRTGLFAWWSSFSSKLEPTTIFEQQIYRLNDFASTFVCEAYRRKGWSSINALYGNPPSSMQQLIHPDLYFNHYTKPYYIHLSGYQLSLHDWTPAYEDTYGEWQLENILETMFGKYSPDVALATHWAGDRVVALERGHEVSVIWLIKFRDALSASRFAKLYGKPRGLQLIRSLVRDDKVLVVLGEATKQFDQFAANVLKESQYSQ